MIILWRILLVVCLGLIGLAAGTFIGGRFFVAAGQGMAAAPMALGYGLLGAVALVVVGLIAAFKSQASIVRNFALLSAVGAAVIYGALAYRVMSKAAAEREPETAFAAAGSFAATMERLDNSDPYLFVKMEVDSRSRTWTQTGPAPDHKICSAKMKAKPLVDVRTALDNLAAMSAEDFAACRAAQGPVIKRLRWSLEGAKDVLDVKAACAQNHYAVARALALVEGASSKASSKVRCE